MRTGLTRGMRLNDLVVRMHSLRRAPLPVFNDHFARYYAANSSGIFRITL